MPKNAALFFFVFIPICCFSTYSYGQSQIKNITKTFDNLVGQENLDINNGVFNLIDYPYIITNRTKYFLKEGYSIGNVTYDDQTYFDVKLKYDLSEDILIYKPKNSGANIGCDLIEYKVDSFSLYGKNFVNVNNIGLPPGTSIDNNYLQRVEIDDQFILYIKYRKQRGEMIKDGELYYFYTPHYNFWINFHNAYSKIDSRNDILNIFPALSEKINDFYDMEESLKSNNPPLFYEKLMYRIHDLLKN